MKNFIIFLCVFFLGNAIYAQTCKELVPFQEGTLLEYTIFNKKGKAKAKQTYDVKKIEHLGNDMKLTMDMTVDGIDEVQEVVIQCADGNFLMDLSNYSSLQNGAGFEVKTEGEYLYFPSDMKKGDTLDDATIDYEVSSDNPLFSASISILNRKVLDLVTKEVPAGEFKSYKISYDYIFDTGPIKLKGSGIEWFAPGIGVVSSEQYNKKGKLRSTRELTKFIK